MKQATILFTLTAINIASLEYYYLDRPVKKSNTEMQLAVTIYKNTEMQLAVTIYKKAWIEGANYSTLARKNNTVVNDSTAKIVFVKDSLEFVGEIHDYYY